MKSWRHIPLWKFDDFDDFVRSKPNDCALIAIEMHGRPLNQFQHPERAVYLLGPEDHGLSKYNLDKSDAVVSLFGEYSLNVSTAGSIVLYDRISRG